MGEPAPNPLRGSAPFRRLLFARTVSHVGDGIALTALVLFVQDRKQSGAAVGVLLLATALPKFLGPLAGAIVDRVEQRTVMVACDLGQAVVFASIAWLVPPFPVLLGLVAAASALETLFAPAGRSAVPALVRPEQLLRANAMLGTAVNIQVAIGPALGGLLVSGLGVRGALAANALSFVVSAVAVVGLPALRAPASGEEDRGFLAGGAEGLRYVWRTRLLRGLAIALFVGVAFAGVDDVALVFLVRETLGGGPLAYGLVAGLYGVGMLAGSLGLSWRGAAAAGTVFALGWVGTGAGAILTGLAPVLLVAGLGQAVAGIGNAVEVAAMDTLVQASVPRHLLGRVFGVVGTAPFAGHALAFAGGGFLVDLTSPRTVFLIGGIGVLAVLLPVMLLLGRERIGGASGA